MTELIAIRRDDLVLPSLEALCLEIRNNNNKCLLCVCYRPPNSTNDFWDDLQYSVDAAKLTCIRNICLTGDLNADPVTHAGFLLRQFATSNDMTIHVEEPTRITDTTSSILDQLLSTVPHLISGVSFYLQYLVMTIAVL